METSVSTVVTVGEPPATDGGRSLSGFRPQSHVVVVPSGPGGAGVSAVYAAAAATATSPVDERREGWHRLDVDGYEVLVGRSARDNDELTFRMARPRDIWLHAAGHAGSHVVVRVPEDVRDVPRNVIERAAQYAAWHSRARNVRGKVEVHICRAADVRKPRGGPAGTVELRRWDSLRVYPRSVSGD